tara:strand:- start:560 stop:1150 length:591 start_codon:yes stop_codon:yes gene_type:complete
MELADAQNRVRNIIDSETTAYFSNDELTQFIRMATDEFVQQYYMAFETTQDSRDKLQNLVVNDTIDINDNTPVDIDTMDGSVIYYRLLSAYVTATPNVNVKIIQISDISSYLNDPFNKADSSNPVIYLAGGSIHGIGFGISNVNVSVKYLKYTNNIEDLNVTTHEEVCHIAARKVLATLGDPRYQAVQAEITERRV